MKNYIIKGLLTSLALTSSLAMAEDYPATNFQPEVIYHDAAANSAAKKGQETARSTSSTKSTASRTASASSVKSAPSSKAEAKDEDSSTALIGLALLAAGGFFFYNKQKSAGSSRPEPTYSAASVEVTSEGLTGVDRYLREHNMTGATGVEKYLENKERETATGVEKYLRDRG